MRFFRTSSAFAALTLALTACGGGEPAETADAAETAGEAMAEVAQASPCYLAGATLEEAEARPSPLRQVTVSVGGHEGTLCYGAPSANGREVMGGLVPFGALWRLGANEATALHITGPVNIGDVMLQPGSYSLYAEPGETEWTFYINSAYERWGIPISDEVRATELGSVTADVETMDDMVETLTFRFEPWDDATMGDLVMEWEHTRVKIHLHPGA